jgi:MFS family permease
MRRTNDKPLLQGVFLGAVDTTVVASLVTDISSSFEKSNQSSWLGTSYLLSTATFTPLYVFLVLAGFSSCGVALTENRSWPVLVPLSASPGRRYGRLADIIGRRYSALIALSLFTVGTALCGLASSMEMLIFARLLAGMGGGGMMAISSIVASDLVPLKKRAMAQGIGALTMAQ